VSVSRSALEALAAVRAACHAIESHVAHGNAPDALLQDAVRMRLVEIAAAVPALPQEMVVSEPEIPWARLGDLLESLVQRHPDPSATVVIRTARAEVPRLRAAVERLAARLGAADTSGTPQAPLTTEVAGGACGAAGAGGQPCLASSSSVSLPW